MNQEPQASPIAVDEMACAAALSVSVHWLRKDRRGKRIVPFYRLGGRIVYSLPRVKEALIAIEEGGQASARRTAGRA